jgi:ribosomal protein S12 methylthiotransferase accessory factor
MSEIYPVDELEWENNSVANELREPILHLADLDNEECADLLEALQECGADDQRLVAAFIGLAPGADAFWKDLRIGELKTLLALACKNEEARVEGCDWIRHFGQINAQRSQVYRCIEAISRLDDDTIASAPLRAMFGEQTIQQARELLSGELRFFGQASLGMNLATAPMHQALMAGYAKLHASK